MGSLAARAAKTRDDKTTISVAEFGAWGLSVKWVRVWVVRESGNPDNMSYVARRIFERADKAVR